MEWNIKTQEKFKLMVAKMPVFHRRIAEEAVTLKAQENAKARAVRQVEEQDVIAALFSDVPKPFYSLMIRLLEDVGFDYRKYGFPRNTNSHE
ncbi:MAG: hypothetical protein A2Y00_09950 [Omnitrophica WOR_2 bacterium GWF2_43_52]|nr:MAG: hypothetical protein A2Y00_09950 [Omnitrophica WOR_2 bacterium GWF2_43_52]OGX53619.1 MAG: hypothetical protein A2460_00755 [Omnitrophica WOR_2 bacterium RIFOXYC2_FULL_43_9]HAH19438.1 hypothetical protein [Candidatus Omnitrophota bacterium]HBG63809.1 hypothetical protein [Candidatus Omnitrophota bacterium]HCD37172.1 hypothetical protein [Candidatus Omnitrophota bacterium]